MLDLTDQFKSPETLERYGFPPLSDGDRYLDGNCNVLPLKMSTDLYRFLRRLEETKSCV